MGELFDKILYFLGIEEEEPSIDDGNEYNTPPMAISEQRAKGKVINIHQTAKNKVIIHKPISFEEAGKICEEIKNRKAAIVNMELLDKETAKRVLDFLSGSIYALSGTVKKIGTGIFIFAPDNVDISDISLEQDRADKAVFLSKYKE